MKGRNLAIGGALTLAAAFSFAALYRPEKIEATGTLAEVSSLSNDLKIIGLRTPENEIVRFDVSGLNLVVPADGNLRKDQVYKITSQESLLDKVVRALTPASDYDFGDVQYKARTFEPIFNNCCAPGQNPPQVPQPQQDAKPQQPPQTLQPQPPHHDHH